MNSLAVHLVAVCVWAGGLVAVLALRSRTRGATGRVVSRYSTLAGWAFAAVAFSGIVNASLRLTGPLDLFTTTYGWLITVKAAILVLLGLAGVVQRRRLVPGCCVHRSTVACSCGSPSPRSCSWPSPSGSRSPCPGRSRRSHRPRRPVTTPARDSSGSRTRRRRPSTPT
ncbi:CopD family protein [Curtobacterium flaccumfaciens]|nr:CopD family protein [Curtobacterium flaccumfaciens]